MGNHNLRIETGRHCYPRIPVHERTCKMCHQNQIEDEYHFFTHCELYKDERVELLCQLIALNENDIVVEDPHQTFINMMSCTKDKCLFYMCIFIKKALSKRDLLVQNM